MARLETTIAVPQAVSPVCPEDTPGRRLTAHRSSAGPRGAGTAPPWSSPRRTAIFRALPNGSRRATSQAAWIRAVQEHQDVAALRADAHRNLMRVAWVLARHADWTELVTRPTWAVLMERTGLSRSTCAAWLAWLRRAGLLGTVTPGTTVQYRRGTACGLLDDGRGTEAAEYVLAVPAPPEDHTDATGSTNSGTANSATTRPDQSASPCGGNSDPLMSPVGDMSNRPTRARDAREDARPVMSDTGWWWPRAATPATRRDQLAAAHRARTEDVTLRTLTARHLRSLLRPVWQRGGTLADVLHMINHRPDGTPWPYAGTPRYLPGWIRHRLSFWLGEELPSRQHAAAARRVAAEQATRRSVVVELAAHRTQDATGHAARARALLASSSPVAQAVMRRQAIGAVPKSRWLPRG